MSKVAIDSRVLWLGALATALVAIVTALSYLSDGFIWVHDASEDHAALPGVMQQVKEIDARSKATEEDVMDYQVQQEARWGEANREKVRYLNEAVQFYEDNRNDTGTGGESD